MKKAIIYLLMVWTFFIISCHDFPTGPARNDSDEIRESVFRYQCAMIHTYYSGVALDTTVKVIYLSYAIMDTGQHPIVHSDPDDSFISRFSDNIPPVKKYSECIISEYEVIDKQSGQRGILLWIGKITRTSSTEATVECGYFFDWYLTEGEYFYLYKANNRWWMNKRELVWFSLP